LAREVHLEGSLIPKLHGGVSMAEKAGPRFGVGYHPAAFAGQSRPYLSAALLPNPGSGGRRHQPEAD